MIYWLCLIICIQSSYCGPPLMRRKHELHKSQLTNHKTDLQNVVEPTRYKSSVKNSRSYNERFPWMKTKFRERATDENNNNISSHRFLIRTPNVKRRSKINHARSKNYVLPHIRSVDSNKDSSFTQSSVFQKLNFKRTQRQNQINSSNLDDNPLNKNHNENGENDHHFHENLLKYDDKDPLAENHHQFMKRNKDEPQFYPPKTEHKPVKESNTDNERREPVNNEDSMRKPKIPDGSSPLGLSKHDLESNQKSAGGSWSGRSPNQRQTNGTVGNEQFMENFEKNNREENSLPNIGGMSKDTKMVIGHQKKALKKKKHDPKHHFKVESPVKKNIPPTYQFQTQIGNEPPPPREYGSMNPPQTHDSFEQNDILQDQQPNYFQADQRGDSESMPIQDGGPKNPEISDGRGEIPQEQQSGQFEEPSMQDPLEENSHLEQQNDMPQDRQDSDLSVSQNNFQNSTKEETPLNSDSIPDNAGYNQENGNSATEELSELYKPILFKLGENSPSIRSSMTFNDNGIDSRRNAEQVESQNVVSPANIGARDTRENETTHFGNENRRTPELSPTYNPKREIEDLSLQSTTTQQVSYFDSTSHHNLKKKSNNFEYYNKYAIDSKEKYPYETIERQHAYFPNKRSNQREPNANMNYQPYLYRKRKENSITTSPVEPDTETSSLSQEDNNSNSIEPFGSESQFPDNKTETFTSIIEEYAMPTIGVRNKILKYLNENQRRSSSQNGSSNFNNLNTDSRHFRNTKNDLLNEQNHVEQNKTNVRSNEISKRNEPEGNIVDKVTRTYEGLKTKQTIIKDSLTNKETNVIENQKEKIVDSINLTKQSKSKPPDEDTENQDSAIEQPTNDADDSYEEEYENAEYEENVENNSESGISGLASTEEMYYDADGNFVDKTDVWYNGISNDPSKGKMDISVNQKSNTFKTDAFKKPPGSNRNDYASSINNKMSQNTFMTSPEPLASNVLPQPITSDSQYSYSPQNEGGNEIGEESENVEPSNDDEYSYQDQNDEGEYGEQSSFMESQDSKSIPEQTTDNFIDLGEEEENKEDVMEDLNEFPTAKLNNKPRGNSFMPEQKKRQRNFYEFSTILPNADNIGEFQREEKVERQSKVIHKNNGIVTNGTSSLFGEKKIEVKDNRQNYHETYMEEKGESKFPNEQADDSEKQKRNDNSSETSIKARQTPEKVFPRKDNEGNSPKFNSNSRLLIPWNRETDERSTKDKKSPYYVNDDSYDEYYYATEDNPENMMDREEPSDDEYDEYVMNPKDVLKNDGRIDGISKRSGALIDVSKLMKNGKALRSLELTTAGSQSSVSMETGSATTSTDEVLNVINKLDELSEKNATESANEASVKPRSPYHNYDEHDSLGKNMSNRQIDLYTEQNAPKNHLSQESPAKAEKSIKRRRDHNSVAISPRSVNAGSGNIVYVTVPSTTDKESKFHDFLQIQEVGRQSRHLGNVYRRQRKHSPRRKTSKFLTNYRINRSSNYNKRRDNF